MVEVKYNFTGVSGGFLQKIIANDLEDLDALIEESTLEDGAYFIIDPSIPTDELPVPYFNRYRETNCVFLKEGEGNPERGDDLLTFRSRVVQTTDNWYLNDVVIFPSFGVIEISEEDFSKQNIGARFRFKDEHKWGLVVGVDEKGGLLGLVLRDRTNENLGIHPISLREVQMVQYIFPGNSDSNLPYKGKETFKINEEYGAIHGIDTDIVYIAHRVDYCAEEENIFIYYKYGQEERRVPIQEVECSVLLHPRIQGEIASMVPYPKLREMKL